MCLVLTAAMHSDHLTACFYILGFVSYYLCMLWYYLKICVYSLCMMLMRMMVMECLLKYHE